MVFSSAFFLFAFLPAVIAVYYLLDRRYKNFFLFIASLIFYGWGEPKFVFMLILSIFMNYLFALLCDGGKINNKLVLWIMAIFNLSIFFVFKYLNFTVTNIEKIFKISINVREFVLPIGISFFTFQAMSYVIDVYRGNSKALKNPLDVGLYIAFFPQLVAGPIVRFQTIEKELRTRKETWADFSAGLVRFIIGISKKVILANTLATVVDRYYKYTEVGSLSVHAAWLSSICYSLQIFFDFSGYSDMAIGLGMMFGFHFPENFNFPYVAKSITDFWRRWHITLSTWFRDYVYIPLGGNRVGKGRLIFNLFVVWLLTGIWHGASWNFIFWGLFYFVLLIFEKLTGLPDKIKNKVFSVLYRIITLFFVNIGWVLFRATGLRHAIHVVKAMFMLDQNTLTDMKTMFIFKDILVVLILAILFSIPWVKWLEKKVEKNKTLSIIYEVVRSVVLLLLFVVVITYCVNGSYNPFIYFNF